MFLGNRTRSPRRRLLGAVLLVAALAMLAPEPALAENGSGNGSGNGSSGATGESTVDADFHTLDTPPLALGQFEVITLSTLPDAVTGGDVLVAVRGLTGDDQLEVTADGRDVTGVFDRNGDDFVGLIEGLPVGESDIMAAANGLTATLTVRNHPVSGPILSGPHQIPFRCRTDDAGLGEPIDADCSIEPVAEWFYRSSNDQGFHPLPDPFGAYPDDVLTTQTSDGDAVPFVARVETRTINRGITRIAVLDDPAARGPDAPFASPTNWNNRVYHAFGESCGVGYQQGTNAPETVLGAVDLSEVDADNLLINLTGITDRLSKGDATIHSTLTSYGVHCNPLISVETMMMIKEHLNERYGPVEAIVGTNGSGAALQQYNAINNAPGLISAAMPTATFADIPSTAMTVTDCGLLQGYYRDSSLDWTDQKMAAVNGHTLLTGNELNAICASWEDAFLDRVIPTEGCSVPSEERYDPATNPKGVRCTIQDANVNMFGADPETGFARRPLDNVGVQYGLAALENGDISPEEFIDLNREIGGYDIDGNQQSERHVMDDEVAALTYKLGQVVGRGAMAETPVLDAAPYLDLIPIANIHESIRPFTIRERLRAHTGQIATQAIFRGMLTQADVYPIMDDWLHNLEGSRPGYGGDHMAAVIAAKPASAADHCTFGTIGGRLELPAGIVGPLGLVQLPLLPGAGVPGVDIPLRVDVPEDFESGLGPCSILLPVSSTPRMVAGMPRSDDVIKCQLRPVTAADYPDLSEGQLDELRSIFPDGVCDYTKPAAADVERSMIWPSLGGDELEPAHELKWRVARSGLPDGSAVPPPAQPGPDPSPSPSPSPGGGVTQPPGTTLPVTGGQVPVAIGMALLGLALLAARGRAAAQP